MADTKVSRYIKTNDKLAAALSMLLPAEIRDDLRRRKVPAKEVIALFEIDHVEFHTWAEDNSVNEWWNLDWKDVASHREKTRIDQGKIAKVRKKVKREALEKANDDVRRILLGERPKFSPKAKPRWKRKVNGKTVRVDEYGKEII